MSSDPTSVKKPVIDTKFPAFVFSVGGKRVVNNVQEFTELIQADGPGVWFDSPAKVPVPAAKVVEDWKAKYAALEIEVAELRKVNGDLVAKLLSKPEPKAKDEPKAVK